MTGNDSVVLRVAGRPVGRYLTRPELPPGSPHGPVCTPSPPWPALRSPN